MIQFRYGKRPFPAVAAPNVHSLTSSSTQKFTSNNAAPPSTSSGSQALSFKDTPARYLRPRIPEFEIALIDAGGAVDPPKPVKPKSKK